MQEKVSGKLNYLGQYFVGLLQRSILQKIAPLRRHHQSHLDD